MTEKFKLFGSMSIETLNKMIDLLQSEKQKKQQEIAALDEQIIWYKEWENYPDPTPDPDKKKVTARVKNQKEKRNGTKTRVSDMGKRISEVLKNHDFAMPSAEIARVVHAQMKDEKMHLGFGKVKQKVQGTIYNLLIAGEVEKFETDGVRMYQLIKKP